MNFSDMDESDRPQLRRSLTKALPTLQDEEKPARLPLSTQTARRVKKYVCMKVLC